MPRHIGGAEQELLLAAVTATAPMRIPTTLITADADYQSEANLRSLAEAQLPALIADGNMRECDALFASQDRHTRLPNPLHSSWSLVRTIFSTIQSRAPARAPCAVRAQRLHIPDTTPVRNLAFFRGPVSTQRVNYSASMRERSDPPEGRDQYAPRFGTAEPVFANPRANKRLDRFTLRDRPKVDTLMEVVLPRTQHREVGAGGVRGVGRLPAQRITIGVAHRLRTFKGASVSVETSRGRGPAAQAAFEIDLSYSLNACAGRHPPSGEHPPVVVCSAGRRSYGRPSNTYARSDANPRNWPHREKYVVPSCKTFGRGRELR